MNHSITIRPANLSDVKKLSILYKTVYIQTYGVEGVSDEFANFITNQFAVSRLEEIIDKHPENIIVAEYKNNLVGVAEIEFNKRSPVGDTIPELNKLYILDWFCGKGVGQMLLQETERIVRSEGYTQMWLWVLISNNRAISFYKKHYYETIGNAFFQMEKNRYENLVMLKDLTRQ